MKKNNQVQRKNEWASGCLRLNVKMATVTVTVQYSTTTAVLGQISNPRSECLMYTVTYSVLVMLKQKNKTLSDTKQSIPAGFN